ncbi:MAG TPA: HEAT repeat domain-containing protein, partial [Planctomycetota bacterium]|nr:HEAT repeat domain-containing protein [Planctomycetota bacterium]
EKSLEDSRLAQTTAQLLAAQDDDKANAILDRALENKNPEIRAAAVETLPHRSDEELIRLAEKFLTDPDVRVRTSAALILDHNGSAKAVGILFARLPQEKNAKLYANLYRMLKMQYAKAPASEAAKANQAALEKLSATIPDNAADEF